MGALQSRDRLRRLLASIWRDGQLVKEQLVQEGLCVPYVVPPNIEYVERIRAAADTHGATGGDLRPDGPRLESPREYAGAGRPPMSRELPATVDERTQRVRRRLDAPAARRGQPGLCTQPVTPRGLGWAKSVSRNGQPPDREGLHATLVTEGRSCDALSPRRSSLSDDHGGEQVDGPRAHPGHRILSATLGRSPPVDVVVDLEHEEHRRDADAAVPEHGQDVVSRFHGRGEDDGGARDRVRGGRGRWRRSSAPRRRGG